VNTVNSFCWHEVQLMQLSNISPAALRSLRASDIGRLVNVRGIVTRASEVKPVIEVAAYSCGRCDQCSLQSMRASTSVSPVVMCASSQCQANREKCLLEVRNSKFLKHQELRLQELPDQVPVGHTPRTVVVECRGELTRSCTAGDVIMLVAIYLPRANRHSSGGLSETYLLATSVEKVRRGYNDVCPSAEMERGLNDIANSPDLLSQLSQSIAPEIFGNDDVKKSLLLQLVGGVTRKLVDGTKVRGDVHVCLMGDPGLAKSQFLKYIAVASPRGVYTTGKGSSGVGLTASVVRDPVSSETMLETGALVLADGGVCCIDEFDKMDDFDRTAIHEVMEQQTVSIAKAGITTTLNARCSVLAAANPAFSRYKTSLSLAQNINFPCSVLSRFDLMFLLLDKPHVDSDIALARHVTFVHRYLQNPEPEVKPLPLFSLRYYIAQAKHFEPCIPISLSNSIIDYYVGQRQKSRNDGQANMTARQLLSVMRLAQALARLRFDDAVNQSDFDEAKRLCRVSQASINPSECSGGSKQLDLKSRAFNVMLDLAESSRSRTLSMTTLSDMCVRMGIGRDAFHAMLTDYQSLAVIHVDEARSSIHLGN